MKTRLSLLVLLLLLFNNLLFSHPHLFIETWVEVLSEDDTITGIRVKWKWDEWWSMDVIADCDLDKDWHFDEEEIQLIYDNYFSAIQRYAYFTEIRINNKSQRINQVKQFSAMIEGDDTVSYTFVFPLEIELKNRTSIDILFNDRTIFTAFDRDLQLVENDYLRYENVSIRSYSYYGVTARFDVISK